MNKEYITTCTHSQVFDNNHPLTYPESRETIYSKTVCIDVNPSTKAKGTDLWFDDKPHGYTFKIKGGDGRELKVYYDWFLVPNTQKNLDIINEIERLRTEQDLIQSKVSKLCNSYET